ncbi:MAG: cell division protein SepF [Pseudonocardiaceae bacterium]
MSALHRLKAYFGMVPADEFDDYGPDYEYRGDEYRGDEHRGDEYRRDEYRSGYDAGYEPVHPVRDRGYAAERPAARSSGRADFDVHHNERAADPGGVAAPRMSTARRPTWAPAVPARGSLAVDTAASIREPLTREPAASPRPGLFAEEEANPLARIVTLHPHNYSEARPIGERYREGAPVIMNLTGMDDKDAKRLVDFAAGLAFALRGSIDKVTNKVFLLSPPNVDVSAEDRRRIAEGGLFNQHGGPSSQ